MPASRRCRSTRSPRRSSTGNRGLPLATVQAFEALPGRGVKGLIDGTLYYLGNHRLAEEIGVRRPSLEAKLEQLETEGKTAMVLATDQHPARRARVADTVRDFKPRGDGRS